MAFRQIPISNVDTDYEFSTALNGKTYLFRFHYNFRAMAWIMDISDDQSIPIYMGTPIHVDFDMLAQISSYRVPPGILLCINRLLSQEEPTRDSFSKDTLLLYDDGE